MQIGYPAGRDCRGGSLQRPPGYVVGQVPEENFASSEHELIQEITAPLPVTGEPDPDPGEADFPMVLRGYDRLAVDAYVKRSQQVIEDLRSTSSPEAAVRRALERVGEEVSGILQRAHETAEQITVHSRSEAEDRVEAARKEAEDIKSEAGRELEAARRDAKDIRARAEAQLTDLDAETDRIWAERHRIVEDARELASQLLVLAESAAERFPPAEESEAARTVTAGALPGEPPPVEPSPEEAAGARSEPPPADETEATMAMPPVDDAFAEPEAPELLHEAFPEREEPDGPPHSAPSRD
jgi:hypothetical protein